jgi:ABC-type Fe3+-hydroxamate transport system substrate-binding protein
MIEVVDDTGRSIVLAQPAQRIVSLVPSLTETIFALGCDIALVGVTRYCTEPAGAVERIERVGGTKNPDCQRIVTLQPDLVVVNAEENRREDFEALERAGLTVFVSFSQRVADVPSLIEKLGKLTASEAAAEHLADEVATVLAGAEASSPARRRRVFCPIWKNPWMSFNRETYTDDMLWLAGGENVCRSRAERYCSVDLGEIAAADPEVILLPNEPYVFAEKDLPYLAPLQETTAYRTGDVHLIDGKALSWYGPRTAGGLWYLRGVLEEGPLGDGGGTS